MSDQYIGMVRESDVIKFECRLLLMAIQNLDLSEHQQNIFLELVSKIIKLENDRLDALKKKDGDLVRRVLVRLQNIEYPPSGKEYYFKDGTWTNNVHEAAERLLEEE